MFTAAQIRGLAQKLVFPGQDALFKAAKREAARANLQAPTRAQIREATSTLTQPQIYGKRPPSGHVVALEEKSRAQADSASFQSLENTEGDKGNTFLLLAIDVYSRKIYGAPVTGGDGPTIRAALQSIFAKAKFKVWGTDAGNEWKNPEVAQYLQAQGVVHQVKDPSDINGLALADSAVQQKKGALFKILSDRHSSIWIDKYQDAIDALHARPRQALGGPAADDVSGSDQMRFLMLKRASAAQERNHLEFQRSRRGLEVGSKFSVPLPKLQRVFRRGARQTFSREVYTVRSFRQQGRQVVADEDGKVYTTKQVLPVAAGSQAYTGRALEQAAQRRTEQVRQQRGQ